MREQSMNKISRVNRNLPMPLSFCARPHKAWSAIDLMDGPADRSTVRTTSMYACSRHLPCLLEQERGHQRDDQSDP